MRTVFRCAAPALLVAALALLPFAGKAFNIDDTLFLLEAQQIVHDPLHPTAFDVVWNYVSTERFSSTMASGPVMAYLLVPVIRAGGSERVAHAIEGGTLALGLLFTVALALRMGLSRLEACYAALLLATAPAVLGMASTAMPDVPAMAFGVAAVERFYAWKVDRRWHQGAAAALLLATGALARGHLLLLIGVCALALLPDGEIFDRRRWRQLPRTALAPLCVAPFIVWGVLRLTHDPHPGTHGLATAIFRFLEPQRALANLTAFCMEWMLTLPLGIGWIAYRRGKLPWKLGLLALPLIVGAMVGAGLTQCLWTAPIAAVGAVVLIDLACDGWWRRDQLQIVLVAWLFLAVPMALYIHLPCKYLVASAPAMAILLARTLLRERRVSRLMLAAIPTLGLLFGVTILRADAAYADVGRQAAVKVIAPAVARGDRVWFLGHWGFQWYAERAGASPLSDRVHPHPGDLLLTALQSRPHGIELVPNRKLVGTFADTRAGGRTMDKCDCAGFYSNGWGYLPWSFGHDDRERFDIWRIR